MVAIRVEFYSDICCVWAYIGQTRLDKLLDTFGEQIDLRVHFMSVFGDVHGKMERSWKDNGGIEGYNEHVQQACADFPDIEIHPLCWTKNTPRSSMPAQLCLSALRRLAEKEECEPELVKSAIRRVRNAFFVEAMDIASASVLRDLMSECGASVDDVEALISSGEAHAVLARDLELTQKHDVRTSPTFSFNDWRQRLEGNVGYRLIEANVRELIERPVGHASWC